MSETLRKLREGEGSQQLICFPYLGGHSSKFLELIEEIKFDNETEVWGINPPGHGLDIQKPFEDISRMLDLYCTEIAKIIKPNCIFFGYSMGGIVAYFAVQRLLRQRDNYNGSLSLIISSCSTPQEFGVQSYSAMSDDMLLNRMIDYDGLPEDVINVKELLVYYLPVFRADFRVLETASLLDYDKLDIPTYFLLGDNDRFVSIDMIIKWSRYFQGELNTCVIRGGSHMMIHDQMLSVARAIERILLPDEIGKLHIDRSGCVKD